MDWNKNLITKSLIKVLLIGVYTLFHLMVLREIRTSIFQYQVDESFVQNVTQSEKLSFRSLDIRLYYIDYNTYETQKTWRYKVPFGSFFFLGIIGLILIGASSKHYYVLIGGHSVVLIISLVLLQLNPATHLWSLMVLDFGTQYLLPLLSLGIIPICFLEKKRGE